MRTLLFSFCLALACAKDVTGSAPTPAPASVPTAAATVKSPAPPRRSPYAISAASFIGEELDECVDFDSVPKPGQEQQALEARDGVAKNKPRDGVSLVALRGTCESDLGGRTELASCAVDADGKFGRVMMTSRFYRYATVGNQDSYLRDCLQLKGKWTTADKTTLERARIQGQMRKLEKLAESPN